MSVHKGENI